MPKIATKLMPAPRGGYVARKAIPADVRDAYGKLYGGGKAQWEAWFNSGPVNLLQARAQHREWSSLVEARIANIRAERKGEGHVLTPHGARALAGEWYAWFIAQMAGNKWPASVWRDYRSRMWEGLHSVADAGVNSFENLDMDHVRPVVADEGKTAQFLAAKRLALDPQSRDLFLDYVARDLFAAFDLLVRRADGDYGEDDYAKRFPKNAQGIADPGLSPWSLFEKWIAESKPATSTINRWRAVFLTLQDDFPNTSAAALLPEQVQDWAKELITAERSAATVRDVWVNACRTVYAWAIGVNLIARNPFVGWRITVPKKKRMRESKSFTDGETKIILTGAMKVKVRSKMDAAKRWVPWICAYNGARAGEITQLRGIDVFKEGEIWAIKISPEAGSVKTGVARSVPLHEHLIEQGFLEFVEASGKGPLFYNHAEKQGQGDPTNPRRPRAVKARERLATWVRKIGVTDPELKPNHAWRHTFKNLGDRAGISEKMLDVICGHAPASVGRGYGAPELSDKAEALRRFPRFNI